MSNRKTRTTRTKAKYPIRDLPVMETFPNASSAWSLGWDHEVINRNKNYDGKTLTARPKTYRQ